VAVGGMIYLFLLQWPWQAGVLGLQVGLHGTVLIAINNLRDRETDIVTNKKTLAVRLGVAFSRYEIAFLLAAPFVLSFVWLQQNHYWAALLPLFVLKPAWLLAEDVFSTDPSPVYNDFLARAAKVHLLFAGLTSVGFLLK
ncbi:MAG: prenyltransferase, partial [Pseudobdellovibrionaceae bacterium]